MTIQEMMETKPEFFRCFAGCDHTTEFVWGSVQQQGVHSKKRLPFFHCGKHSVRGRPDNWRSYPLKTAVWLGEHILPCATCFPSLSKEWLNLLRP